MSNPIPDGTTNITVNAPEELHASLKALAAKSGMKLSAYIREVLKDAAANNAQFKTVVKTVKVNPPTNGK